MSQAGAERNRDLLSMRANSILLLAVRFHPEYLSPPFDPLLALVVAAEAPTGVAAQLVEAWPAFVGRPLVAANAVGIAVFADSVSVARRPGTVTGQRPEEQPAVKLADRPQPMAVGCQLMVGEFRKLCIIETK